MGRANRRGLSRLGRVASLLGAARSASSRPRFLLVMARANRPETWRPGRWHAVARRVEECGRGLAASRYLPSWRHFLVDRPAGPKVEGCGSWIRAIRD